MAAERLTEHLIGVNDRLPVTCNRELNELGQRYGLDIVTDANFDDTDVAVSAIDNVQCRLFAELLDKELQLYTPAILKRTGLQRLILCNHLVHDRQKEPLLGTIQIGLFIIDSLLLDAQILHAPTQAKASTFHHELFHVIDYRDSLCHYMDPDWRLLNHEGFSYNGDAWSDPGLPNEPKGFVSRYATRWVAEDKAETYACMITRYKHLAQRAESDLVLASKIKRMKELLHHFSEDFDEVFWERIAARRD
jgi:hypothetical protein